MIPFEAEFPLAGKWKLTSCETSRPDLPQPASLATTFALKEGLVHYANDVVWSDGRAASVSAVVSLDGSWFPLQGSFLSDSLSLHRLEDGSFEAKTRKGGADVGTTRYTVSSDGQTLTGHWTVKGPFGNVTTLTVISERQ